MIDGARRPPLPRFWGSLSKPAAPDVDVWAALANKLELAGFRPKLAPDIEVRIFRLRWGNDYAMVANPRRLIHFQLEVWEAQLAQRMDGTLTVGELLTVEHLEGTGDLDGARLRISSRSSEGAGVPRATDRRCSQGPR